MSPAFCLLGERGEGEGRKPTGKGVRTSVNWKAASTPKPRTALLLLRPGTPCRAPPPRLAPGGAPIPSPSMADHSQAGSDTAVCEDLWELLEDADGE